VGDSRTGRTSSFNVLYGPLKALARGAIPAIPGRRRSPVDVVPVDYVADRTVELAEQGADGTYHLVAGRNATTVGRLLELASERLGRKPPAVVPPTAYRRLLHPWLRRKYSGLRRMEVYFPYFSMRVRFDDRRLGPAPPVESYFHRLVDFAERARWGRAVSAG
jgi:nucleoside-diphosphate-sugar epimerase